MTRNLFQRPRSKSLGGVADSTRLPLASIQSVEQKVESIKNGELCNADFCSFLGILESTPFGDDAPDICNALFDFVNNNLHVQKEDEIIALGCAIRKLIFNLEDSKLGSIVELLGDLADSRVQGRSTRVEKMICKALADRFEAYPFLYTETVSKGIADRLALTVKELFVGNSWHDQTTNATLGQAILGFLCYADEYHPFREELKKRLRDEIVPGWFLSFYRNYSIPFQNNVEKNWPETSITVPDIRGFFEVE